MVSRPIYGRRKRDRSGIGKLDNLRYASAITHPAVSNELTLDYDVNADHDYHGRSKNNVLVGTIGHIQTKKKPAVVSSHYPSPTPEKR